MSYTYHEDVSIADIAFSAEADSLEKLLVEGAKATFETMVNLAEVKSREKRDIKLEADSPEKLFFEWIEELIYLKDADYLVFSKFEVTIKKGQKYFLEGTAWGEKIDPKRHTLRVDVKAITYHHFSVEQEKGKWKAFVILDI